MTTGLRQSPSARMEEDGGEGPPRDRPRYGPHQDTILPTASGKRGPHHQSLLQSPASPASPYLSRNTHLPTVLELPLSSGFLSPPRSSAKCQPQPRAVPTLLPLPGQHPECPTSDFSRTLHVCELARAPSWPSRSLSWHWGCDRPSTVHGFADSKAMALGNGARVCLGRGGKLKREGLR